MLDCVKPSITRGETSPSDSITDQLCWWL